MDFLKTIAGKVLMGLVALGVVIGGISWWQMDPASRSAVLTGTGRMASWLGIVLVIPWATFFIIGRIARFESNLAGGLLVFTYTALEFVLLLWLMDWSVRGAGRWTFVGFGGLLAAVYNLFACDWIAEKVA
jgi:hypothetical protein